MPTILFADNDQHFSETAIKYLENAGYKVVYATNPPETRALLAKGGIDLAVLDIRLIDDKDEGDESGLDIAVETSPIIPKIIFTSFPDFKKVSRARRARGHKLPAAIDFLDKIDGLEALVNAIKENLPMRDVFIVHGHDDAALSAVENFLYKAKINPVILKNLPNAGQTIIEKLEESAGVTYAIVLLTPDDLCQADGNSANLEGRARQNVIFELGYFYAKLGRARVCALYKDGTVLPSDIQGVMWIRMDREGAWKFAVAREMRAAGLYVDLNDIL